MPKFDRSVIASIFPKNLRAIADFEKLNNAVDVDLPDATAIAQATADEARLLSIIARANTDALRPVLDAVQAFVLNQRTERTQIAALERRVADLEARLLAAQRGADDQMRRQVADLQALQTRR